MSKSSGIRIFILTCQRRSTYYFSEGPMTVNSLDELKNIGKYSLQLFNEIKLYLNTGSHIGFSDSYNSY